MRIHAKTVFRQWLVLACAALFQAGITGRGAWRPGSWNKHSRCISRPEGPLFKGQKWSGPGVELFAPHIVSTGLLEASIAFAPDGRACYFSVTLPPALSVIVVMKQEKAT